MVPDSNPASAAPFHCALRFADYAEASLHSSQFRLETGIYGAVRLLALFSDLSSAPVVGFRRLKVEPCFSSKQKNMKLNIMTKAQIDKIKPDVLAAWRKAYVAQFIATKMREVVRNGLPLEMALSSMCTGIKEWLELNIADKYTASLLEADCDQLAISLLIEIMMQVRSIDQGEAQ